MGVAADDHVDAGHGLGEVLVDIVADMADDDDLVDPGAFERLDGALHILGDALERHVRTGRGDIGGVLGGGADDADLLTTDIENDHALGQALQVRVLGGVEIAADDRELGRGDELGELGRTVVELVVACGDHVEAHVVHEVGDDLGLVLGIEQRTLELVARREQHDVLAGGGGLGALGVDGGLQARDAAEALALLLAFGVAGRVGAGDGFEARVEIIDVEDFERELGLRGAGQSGRQRQRRGAEQQLLHISVPLRGIRLVRTLLALHCNAGVTSIRHAAGRHPQLQWNAELTIESAAAEGHGATLLGFHARPVRLLSARFRSPVVA